MNRGVYIDELAPLPLSERVQRMRDPEMKRRVLADVDREVEDAGSMSALASVFLFNAANLYPLSDGFDYEPMTNDSLGARASRTGKAIDDVLYDYLIENGGIGFAAILSANYQSGNLDVVREMLAHPETVCKHIKLSTILVFQAGPARAFPNNGLKQRASDKKSDAPLRLFLLLWPPE
jgi:N-acyl-D-amino-acid deacylase